MSLKARLRIMKHNHPCGLQGTWFVLSCVTTFDTHRSKNSGK